MIQLRKIENESPWVISQLANNYEIAKNLRDIFPHPYTIDNAVSFIELAKTGELGLVFGIYSENEFIGCCSLNPQSDVYRINAEVGYWIGEPFQGLGIVSDALSELISYIFTETDLIRLYALTFDFNEKSMRVLRRNGFKQLAVMHRMGIKNGKIIDMHYYELLKPY